MKEFTFTLREARQIMASPPKTNERSSVEKEPSERWDEGIGYKGAFKALRRGIKRRRLRQLQNRIKHHISAHQQEVETERLSRKGRKLDRQRYRQGRPRCTWEDTTATDVQPAVRIEVDMCVNGITSSRVLMQRGAAVLALVREARRQGIPTIIDAVGYDMDCFSEYTGECLWRLRVKQAGESVAQTIVNFCLTHSALLRRVFFRLQEHVAEQRGWSVAPGYGRSIHERPEETSGDLFIPEWAHIRDPEKVVETAIEWTQDIKNK